MINNTDLLLLALHAFPSSVIINESCEIVFMNASYRRFLGVDHEDIIGKHVSEVIPGTKMPEIVATGRTDDNHLMLLYDHINSKMENVLCKRIPLRKDGKIVGAAGIVTIDQMSEIVRLNHELDLIKKENEQYRRTISDLKKNRRKKAMENIIGDSAEINECRTLVTQFAQSDLPILLTGETGTGKEVFAKAIHEYSNRLNRKMVEINCSAIPSELLESELFGYEPGAFTGAKSKGKAGIFEIADHSTLLLDEIGEMPVSLQPKLLRVLQEQRITRIGGLKEHKIDVRILASTNKDPKKLISSGLFREDLYYRINSVEIEIPPLRQHFSDLESLTDHFIEAANEKYGIHTRGIAPNVLELFRTYSWPGNIRELKHAIERLSYLNPNSTITLKDCGFIRKKILENGELSQKQLKESGNVLKDLLALTETEAITNALKKARGNKTEAAKLLNIDRSALYDKLKKYNILEITKKTEF